MFRSSTSLTESEAQVGFLFHVMIGVNPLGEFRAVKGLGRTVEQQEIREGGRNHSPHLRVGPAKYKECTIEWGMSNRTTLFDWIHAVEAGYGYKRQVWIVQLSRNRTPLRIYQLVDAFPVSWEGAELNANDNVVDTEQITIVYEAVLLLTMPEEITNLPSFSMPDVTVGEEGDATSVFQDVNFEAEVEEDGPAVRVVKFFGDTKTLATATEEEALDMDKRSDEDTAKWLEEQAAAAKKRREEGTEGLAFDGGTPAEEGPGNGISFGKGAVGKTTENGPLKLSGGGAGEATESEGMEAGDQANEHKAEDPLGLSGGNLVVEEDGGSPLKLSGGTLASTDRLGPIRMTGELPAEDEPTSEESAPAERPAPTKLRMSGGQLFAPTTFERGGDEA